MSRQALFVLALTVSLGWLVGCGSKPPEPEEARIQGDAGAVRQVLERLLVLENTPIAQAAGRALQALEPCGESGFETRAAVADLDLLLEHLECRPKSESPNEGVLSFQLPWKALDGRAVTGTANLLSDGSLALSARLPDLPKTHPASVILPDSNGALPRLNPSSSLFHSFWRARHGFDFAAMVEAGSELDRLWGLRAEVLSSAVLDGTAELAVYLPSDGRLMPGMAAALGVRSRRAAAGAADAMSEQLAATWSVPRSRFRVGNHDGLCLTDLKMLPDLAPCYVVTDHQLVLGWNAASLQQALAPHTHAPTPSNRTTVHLDRFPEADRRIAEAKNVEVEPMEIPWSRMTIVGFQDDAGSRFEIELKK